MKFFKIYAIISILVLIIGCSSPTTSGEKTGTIIGTIYDAESGSTLHKANVITNPPTFSVTTDSLGTYSITNVEPGTYRVTAAKNGYDSSGVNISVAKGLETIADISLQVDTSYVAQ